ncbi:MAG TPA: TPM domain-containing protein [Methylomirabilota bacterium]|nr:TPM domain-containing protein [Methylomirabilota bacterium]
MPPAPTARVNDYAGLLDTAQRTSLESLLAERERATGAQMVVAIFRSLEGESLEDYSVRLAERWRIGQKGLDNGVILLVFVQDRQIRLEVGYGLESVITDAVASRIIREVIAPQFRNGRHAAGLEDAVREVYARIGPGAQRARGGRGGWEPFVPVAFIVLVIVVMVVSAMTGAHHVRPGRRMYTGRGDGWYVPPISPGWGGRGWGGGSSGGGFSGGGGSFGGGGASGRW